MNRREFHIHNWVQIGSVSISGKYKIMMQEDETSLIEGLRSGQNDAFQLAVTRYSRAMLATARAIAGPANAEDIVQDAWLMVFERIESFEQRASFNTWLQRIVANRAISTLRSRSREVSQTSEEEASVSDWFDATGSWASTPTSWGGGSHGDSPDALLAAEDLQDCIDKHLLNMPDNQRSVLVLRDMQQMQFEEICNELSLSASNARVLLHRARMRLMKMVNHFEETGSC